MPMDLARVLQEAGVTPDPAAGRAFRYAAAAMAMSGDPQDRRRWGREAVDALAGLASAKCDAELRSLLTPDPVNQNVTWTVACYQVGDLAPSAVRDFSEPSDAIATLAACPDVSHVAAELVASTQFGLRWTALVRTNDVRQFQLPSAETASDASHTHGAELADALRRWRRRLTKWAEERSDVGGGDDDADFRPSRPLALEPAPEDAAPELEESELDDNDLEARPAHAERTPALRDERPARRRTQTGPLPISRINHRFSRVEQAVKALGTSVEAQAERADRLEHVLTAMAETVEAQAERAARVEEAVTAIAGMVHDQVVQADRLEDALGDTHGILKRWSAPLAALAAAVETVDRGLAGLALLRGELHGVADRSESVRVTMQARVDAVGSAIGEHQATVERRIAELERRLTQDVTDSTDATAKRLRHLMQTVEDMELRADTQRQAEAERLETVVRRIETSVQQSTVDLTGLPEQVQAAVVDSVRTMDRGVSERLARMEAASATADERLSRALNERANRLEQTVNDAAGKMTRATTELSATAGNVEGALTEAATSVAGSLEGVVAASTQALGANLDERAARLEALFAKASHGLEQSVDGHLGTIEASLAGLAADLDERASRHEALSVRTSQDLAQAVEANLATIAQAVEGSRESLTQALGALDTSVTGTVEQRLAGLEVAMADALRALVATQPHGELRETIAALRRELLG